MAKHKKHTTHHSEKDPGRHMSGHGKSHHSPDVYHHGHDAPTKDGVMHDEHKSHNEDHELSADVFAHHGDDYELGGEYPADDDNVAHCD